MFGYNMSHECVSGHLNILHCATLFTILHMTLPVTPVYAAILILRRGVALKLRSEKAMSENTRQLHAQLLKAISYQACIPIFFFIAVLTYAVGQLGILNDPLLEYSSFILVGVIPMLTPLTSLYFIRPYRMWVSKNLLRRSEVISIASQVQESSNLPTGMCTVTTLESQHRK
ncbi:hypothetical protein ANCCAN_04888 [Ancylostoma caninum]|uniref:G protein-coupled receptor n=1 Tax=Ancylostoma caninum TaxID=29170 RepID=A0A368GXD7_ANCCA|nr:hypothetical protein ANCCAN_04888 [Ancylostoma caninum]